MILPKQHFFQFKQAWKQAINSPKNKRTIRIAIQHDNNDTPISYVDEAWITAEHMLLHNIICGKPLLTGFVETTTRNTPENLSRLHNTYVYLKKLKYKIELAKKIVNPETSNVIPCDSHFIDRFLKPFNGTVTIADISKINLDEIETVLLFD